MVAVGDPLLLGSAGARSPAAAAPLRVMRSRDTRVSVILFIAAAVQAASALNVVFYPKVNAALQGMISGIPIVAPLPNASSIACTAEMPPLPFAALRPGAAVGAE